MATPTEHAATTRIQLCGEFVVEVGGRRVDAAIAGRQGRALFTYLVLNRGRTVRREELVEVLWPEVCPESPESSLSTIISRLRKVVGHEMVRGRSALQLELPTSVVIDFESAFEEIERAEEALALSAWHDATRCAEAALGVAARGFVAEVDASWAEDERRRLGEVRLRALECLAACGLALGGSRLSATEHAAQRLIESAPFRETGYHHLMQALAARGRVAEALRVFDDVRVLLQEELGVAPSVGLRTLHERLLSQTVGQTTREDDTRAVAGPTTSTGLGTTVVSPPLALPGAVTRHDRGKLLGREPELARLWGVYEHVKRGDCRVAVICGEPGIGKTRLAVELASRAHRDGAVALYGGCDEEPLVAHQPFVEALGHYVGACPLSELEAQIGPTGGELRRLSPALAERLPALPEPVHGDPEGERYRLFEAVGALLRQACQTRPVVLVLDDLHWADKSTLLLLRHLARHSRPTGLLVVGTHRDVEIGSAHHALRDTLADLSRDPGCQRTALGPLDLRAVDEFVRSAAGDQAPELVRRLCDETEGNPFFLREMLRHLAESGGLSTAREPGTRSRELGVPQGVKDVIGQRIGQLGQRTRAVLANASVLGRTFECEVLEHLSGRGQDELLEALDEAVGARVIEEVPEAVGRYTFTHALIRETVYGDLMRTRRALLHRRVAVALEKIHAADLDAGSAELAHHFAQAGAPSDIVKAIEYAACAGDGAVSGLAYEQAAAHYRQAVCMLESAALPARPARRCDLLIAQGSAERQAGEPAYRTTLLDAARIAQQVGDADRLARAALANNRGFFSAAADVDAERVSVLNAALEAHGVQDTPARASLLAQLAVELVPDTDWKRRNQLSDEALAMARRIGEPTTLAGTLNHRYVALWGPRTLSERIANSREASELADGLGDPVLSFQCARFQSHAAMESGNLALADTLLERAGALAEQLGQPIIGWYYAVTRAKRSSISDRPAEAEGLVREAFELGQRVGQPDASLWRSLGLFVTRLLQGTLSGPTRNVVQAARGEAPEAGGGTPPSRSVALLNAGLRAATASETGRSADTRAHFDVLMRDELGDLPEGWTALAVPTLAAMACTSLGDVQRARMLFEMLEPYRGRFVDAGPSWLGAVSHQLGGLATTLGKLDEADAYFAEAARAYASLRANAWLIRVKMDWARTLVMEGTGDDVEHARTLLTDVLCAPPSIGVPEVQRTAVSLLGMPAFAG